MFLLSRNVGVSVGHLGGLYAVIFTFIHAGVGPCVSAGKNACVSAMKYSTGMLGEFACRNVMFQLPTNCFSSSGNVSCAMEMPVFLLVKVFVFLLEKIKMFLLAEMLVFLSKKI